VKRIAIVVHEEKPHAADAAKILAAACMKRDVEAINVACNTL
jgi:hypothetical protein